MSSGLRKRPTRPYEVRIPSTTVRDTRLSFRALGILGWVLDQADGWDVRSEQMANAGKQADGLGPGGKPHLREGREAIRTALRELAAAGYYRLERRRMRDGTTKMGTAVSTEPVASWAEQYVIFNRKAVPVVEQPDGTFWVRYPDGTLQPDDWPPPQPAPDPAPGTGGVSAGQTGDGFSGPGGPGPEEPAPGKPASGEPASGIAAPLVVTSSGFHKVSAPPPPPTPTAAVVVEEEVPPTRDQDQFMDEVLTAAPHWSRRTLAEMLSEPDMLDRAARDPAAFRTAVIAVATGRYGHTASPRRLLEAGPWWADAHGIPRQPRSPDAPDPGPSRHGCIGGVVFLPNPAEPDKDIRQPCTMCAADSVAA